MNLDSVNTVSDLISKNEESSPEETLMKLVDIAVEDHGMKVALKVALEITNKLVAAHETIADSIAENGEITEALVWADDAGKLKIAGAILSSIEI